MRGPTRMTACLPNVAVLTVYLLCTCASYAGPLPAEQPSPALAPGECHFAALKQASSLFKHEHLRSKFDAPADNEAYTARVLSDHEPENTLYYHTENVFVKTLNEKILPDKETTAATLNLYKKVFFDILAQDRFRFLTKRVPSAGEGGVYSDFKTIRLVVNPRRAQEVPKLQEALQRLHAEVGTAFTREMNLHPELRALYESRHGLISDPTNWNLAGIGNNPNEAAVLAARAVRARPGERRVLGQPIRPHIFGDAERAETASSLKEIETLRTRLEHRFQNSLGVFSDGIPTVKALDLLRRAQGEPTIHDEKEYRAYIRRKFKIRFGVDLTDETIIDLQTYYRRLDQIPAPLYIRRKEPIALASLEKATHGVMSFDRAMVGNQGKRARATALRLAVLLRRNKPGMTDAEFVALALELGSQYQMRESDALEEKKIAIHDSLDVLHVPGLKIGTRRGKKEFTSSGDDATFLPDRDVTLLGQARVTRRLAQRKSGENDPGYTRGTSQPQRYVDTGETIQQDERFGLISDAEKTDKLLRDTLEFSDEIAVPRVPSEELDNVVFAIRIHPRSLGKTEVDILFCRRGETGPYASSIEWRARIRAALKVPGVLPENFRLGKVFDADAIVEFFPGRN